MIRIDPEKTIPWNIIPRQIVVLVMIKIARKLIRGYAGGAPFLLASMGCVLPEALPRPSAERGASVEDSIAV
jgi:hypothetical protein